MSSASASLKRSPFAHGRRLHDVVERLALDVLHHEIVVAFRRSTDVDRLHDVVVRQPRGGLAFLVEAIDELGVFAASFAAGP